MFQHGGHILKDYSAASVLNSGTPGPADVAGLAHWYNLLDLARLEQSTGGAAVANDGDPVGNWIDQIVAADNVEQATTSAKPTYRSAVAALNNQPALSTDGGDHLQGAFTASLAQPNTIFVVCQNPSIANRFVIDGVGATRHAIWVNAGNWSLFAGATINGSAADANANILCAVFNGASSTLHANGVSKVSGNAGTNALGGLTVASNTAVTLRWAGFIADILIYDGLLSAADKNIVQNYLSVLYGISVTEF